MRTSQWIPCEDPGDYIASVACEYDHDRRSRHQVDCRAAGRREGLLLRRPAGRRRVREVPGRRGPRCGRAGRSRWRSLPPCTLTGSPTRPTTSPPTSSTPALSSTTSSPTTIMMAQGCYNALKDAGKEGIPIVVHRRFPGRLPDACRTALRLPT